MTEQHFRTYLLDPLEVHSEQSVILANSGIFSVEPDVATQVLALFDVIRIGYAADYTSWCFSNLTDKQVPIGLRRKQP